MPKEQSWCATAASPKVVPAWCLQPGAALLRMHLTLLVGRLGLRNRQATPLCGAERAEAAVAPGLWSYLRLEGLLVRRDRVQPTGTASGSHDWLVCTEP